MEGQTSGSRGRGRGTSLPPLALQRSLLESISSPPPPTTSEVPMGRGGRKKTGRGKAGGDRGKGRRTTAAPSSPPPPADSPEHRVDPSSDTPVHQPELEEEATSTRVTWSPWPDQSTEGEAGAEGSERVITTDDEEVAEGTTVYQRGGTRIPAPPVTPAHKSLITPDGEK